MAQQLHTQQQYFKCDKEGFDELQNELREFGIIIIPERSSEVSKTISIESNKDLKVIPVYNQRNNSQSFNRYQLQALEKYNYKFDNPSNLIYFVIERVIKGVF